MNLEAIKINFDTLFKDRIKTCGIYEYWQKPLIREKYKYFWYELPRTDSDEPWIVVFNPYETDKDIITLFNFEGEDITGWTKICTGSVWVLDKIRENSKCITDEEFKLGYTKFNMSKWWDDCVCKYLRAITQLQYEQKKFRKLKMTDSTWVKTLHREIRKVASTIEY